MSDVPTRPPLHDHAEARTHDWPSTRHAWRCVCGAPIFFRNSQCLSCGRQLGYEPERGRMVALEIAGAVNAVKLFGISGDSDGRLWHRCANFHNAAGCNWLRPAALHRDDDANLCIACSLNRVIPDQSVPENQELWARVEAAKRRLVSQLLALQLPVRSLGPSQWQDTARGLAFDFLRDWPDGSPITTGHLGGVITVNVVEADDAVRERTRAALHEPYRTLLGHLRHEIAHYYWDRLVRDTAWLGHFRQLFGDEREDYAAALHRHYEQGAAGGWQMRHVSAYASSHPWEDWAETWAHYLHIRDAMDTATSFGLDAHDVELTTVPYTQDALWDTTRAGTSDFLALINNWLRITGVLNELSDSIGQKPFYPFVLPRAVVGKLQLVHELIRAAAT
jgi:hypothetical protein